MYNKKMAHKTQEKLSQQVNSALEKIKVGQLYYHYKNPNHLYILEFVGCLESSEEVCVGYRSLYGKGILWIRSLENFLSKTQEGKMRFKLHVK